MPNIGNQGNCGSCFTFASAAALSATYNFRRGFVGNARISIKPQFFIDCVNSNYRYGGNQIVNNSQGCCGGTLGDVARVVRYFIVNGLRFPRRNYPYRNFNRDCRRNNHGVITNDRTLYNAIPSCIRPNHANNILLAPHIVNYVEGNIQNVPKQTILRILRDVGPFAAGLHVPSSTRFTLVLAFYADGIIEENVCAINAQNNHEIVVFGHEDNNGSPYWLIRNSWGRIRHANLKFDSRNGINVYGVLSNVLLFT